MVSPLEALKAAGFEPTPSNEGEFKARKGTYRGIVETLCAAVDTKNDNTKYYQLEIGSVEKMEGEEPGGLKFRKRFYVGDPEKGAEKLGKMLDILFTWGVELDKSSDSALEASFSKAIGTVAYLRSWGWKPENSDRELEMWNAMKAEVAENKTAKADVPF